MALLIAAALAYLLGSIPFAVVFSRLFGLADPRSFGSGNPGATNVLRSGNKKAAVLTLIFDALKGTLAVLVAQHFQTEIGGFSGVAVVTVAVFIGHVFPIFLRFRGGKGVATALGITFAIAWWLGLAVALVWLACAAASRYSSLASLCGALFAPLFYWLMAGERATTLALLLIGVGIVVRHYGNIKKLLAGSESRIGSKTVKPDPGNSANA
jgi:glycerol-3-phosphate acyltransferase PlsY